MAKATHTAAPAKRLPRGPHSLSREQVAANQRERLILAMVELVGEQGYVATTVSEVASRAGVSRKAFYEHFSGRGHCFLAAYDQIIAEGIADVEGVARENDGMPAELGRSLETLFGRVAKNRDGARLVLMEVTALGPMGIDRREQLVGSYERLLRESLGVQARPGVIPNPLLRALVGGVLKVVCTRVQKGTPRQLRALIPDLVSWSLSYAPLPGNLVAIGELTSSPPSGLVGGRAPGTLAPSSTSGRRRAVGRRTPSVSRSFVAHSQRERILDAVARLSAEKGYGALALEEIAEHASVSLQAFYEHFLDKEDAFLVAYEVGHGKALAMVERAHDAAPDWPTGVRAGITALYEFLASEPAFTRLSLVDALIATPRTNERVSKGMTAYASLLAEGIDETVGSALQARLAHRDSSENGAAALHRQALQDGRVSPASVMIEAISGGIFELCLAYAVKDRIAYLSELVPWTTYFALAPIVGPERAGAVAMRGSSSGAG